MNSPKYYVRGAEIHDNTYQKDAHPNDKSSKAVKGKSRGKMIGFEEAGWMPCATHLDALKLAAESTNTLIGPKPVISRMPVNALRYIILQNMMDEEANYEITWIFANAYTSHSELEEQAQQQYGRQWQAVGGAFYCFITGNAGETSLKLFGKSDSYGLNKLTYLQAKPMLELLLPGVPIDDSDHVAYFEKKDKEQAEREEYYRSKRNGLPF